MIDLFQPGAYARSAGGNLERPDIQAPVIKWMSWSINSDNGGGGSIQVWDKCRSKWDAAGILNFPWLHCRNMKDVDRLIQTGTQENSPAIGLNIEDVNGDKLSLQQVSGEVLDFWVNTTGGAVHLPTLDWVQNGQGWQWLDYAVAALEMFPGEGSMPNGFNPTVAQQCIDHAFAEGLTKVTPMFKTKGMSPQTYGSFYSICHSLYTADDITPDAPSWNAWKQDTCTPLKGVDMLTPTQKKAFREEIVHFTTLAEQYEARWHYSQNRPYHGLGAAPQTYHLDDCSSYAALIFYWAAHHTGVRVSDPLDFHFSGYGNTQSAYEYLKAHKAPKDKYRIGDMAIYGPSYDTVHMTICRKEGTGTSAVWSSFGREAGPEGRTDVHYHPSALLGVFRHPALL